MTERLRDLPETLKDDALTLLCGDWLGTGIGRQVYACKINPEWVVKVEVDGSGRFQNHREWYTWNAFIEVPKLAAYLAPCIAVSDLGSWLIMKRTRPVTLAECRKRAPHLPAVFTDLKAANWGLIGDKLVCHDYGTRLEETIIGTRKAKWWE